MGVSDISADAGRASPSCWGPTKGQVLVSTVEGRCFQSGCRENTENAGRALIVKLVGHIIIIYIKIKRF